VSVQLPLWNDEGPAPLTILPVEMRETIERLAAAAEPPPRWLTIGDGLAQIASRAFYEWHLRRGRDIRKRPLRETISSVLRAAVIERDGYVCQLCGGDVEPDDVHLDHRRPVSHGGPTTLANLQVAHSRCNLRKGARALECEA